MSLPVSFAPSAVRNPSISGGALPGVRSPSANDEALRDVRTPAERSERAAPLRPNNAPRSESGERRPGSVRPRSAPERGETVESTDPANVQPFSPIARRENTPPLDFSALLAMLAAARGTEAVGSSTPVEAPDPNGAAANGSAVESLAREVPNTSTESARERQATAEAVLRLATSALLASGTVSLPEIGAVNARPALPAELGTILNTRASMLQPNLESAASRESLAMLALRAQSMARGELLARNDTAAADVRSALDSLLDVAGTPAGLTIANADNPELEAALALSASDISRPIRTLGGLATEFRSRVDRVIDRMRDEFGHDVQIVETVRSQERQDHLFAQGRTRPGPVVTWTTDSAHLSGEAVDVIVDGKWNHPEGFQRLHRIAGEEGLNTLGMRDPGHLELRGAAGLNANGLRSVVNLNAPQPAEPEAAPLASSGGIARVASVARVARVAQIARVARPGSFGPATSPAEAPAEAAPSRLPQSILGGGLIIADAGDRAAGTLGGGQSEGSRGDSARDSNRNTRRDSAVASRSSLSDAIANASLLSSGSEPTPRGEVPRVAMPAVSTSAARAEAIAVLREDAAPKSIHSLTMQLDGADGGDAVQVRMRGGAVDAQVRTNNAELADRIRLQTADLQSALQSQGLESDTVRVRATTRTQDVDALRGAVAERSDVLRTNSAGHNQHAGTDSGARDRSTPRQQSERDARDARDARADQDENNPQGRRNNRQENR